MSKMLDDDEATIGGTIIKRKNLLMAPVVVLVCIFGLAIWIVMAVYIGLILSTLFIVLFVLLFVLLMRRSVKKTNLRRQGGG
jgi:Flp pilus assembly protein TadB